MTIRESFLVNASWHIASSHCHRLSQVRLLKRPWLAEPQHFENTGKHLTPAERWGWECGGPYSKDVINTIREGTRHFRVSNEKEPTIGCHRALHARTPTLPNVLSEERLSALRDAIDMYSSNNTKENLAEAYTDPFFENTAYGEDFDFPNLESYPRSAPKAKELLDPKSVPVESIEALFE